MTHVIFQLKIGVIYQMGKLKIMVGMWKLPLTILYFHRPCIYIFRIRTTIPDSDFLKKYQFCTQAWIFRHDTTKTKKFSQTLCGWIFGNDLDVPDQLQWVYASYMIQCLTPHSIVYFCMNEDFPSQRNENSNFEKIVINSK